MVNSSVGTGKAKAKSRSCTDCHVGGWQNEKKNLNCEACADTMGTVKRCEDGRLMGCCVLSEKSSIELRDRWRD